MYLWLCVVLSVLQSANKAAPGRMFMENYTQLISLNHCNKEEHPIPANWDAADSLFTKVKFCSWGWLLAGKEINSNVRAKSPPSPKQQRKPDSPTLDLFFYHLFCLLFGCETSQTGRVGKHQHAERRTSGFWSPQDLKKKKTHSRSYGATNMKCCLHGAALMFLSNWSLALCRACVH